MYNSGTDFQCLLELGRTCRPDLGLLHVPLWRFLFYFISWKHFKLNIYTHICHFVFCFTGSIVYLFPLKVLIVVVLKFILTLQYSLAEETVFYIDDYILGVYLNYILVLYFRYIKRYQHID